MVYLASPWFNPTQAEREERVKNKLKELGYKVFSPRENNNLSPITDPNIRKQVFETNIIFMRRCDIIFVITDEKDMGTIWEAGFCYGLRNERNRIYINNDGDTKWPLIVYYCETLGDGMFNLMLAQSGDIVITKFEDLDKLPGLIASGEGLAYVGSVE